MWPAHPAPDRVHDAGALAVLLPITEQEPEELLELVDALIRAGGARRRR